jgi:hypothetical protein
LNAGRTQNVAPVLALLTTPAGVIKQKRTENPVLFFC